MGGLLREEVPRTWVVLPFSPGTACVRADTGWIGSFRLASHQQQLHKISEPARPMASIGQMHNLSGHHTNITYHR